eukprot:s122_g3.t1
MRWPQTEAEALPAVRDSTSSEMDLAMCRCSDVGQQWVAIWRDMYATSKPHKRWLVGGSSQELVVGLVVLFISADIIMLFLQPFDQLPKSMLYAPLPSLQPA